MPLVLLPLLIEEPDRVRTLLEDVENLRRAKMYEGMGSAAQEVQQAVKVILFHSAQFCCEHRSSISLTKAHQPKSRCKTTQKTYQSAEEVEMD